MDPIDRIAAVFESDCVRALKLFSEIQHILETSLTVAMAHHIMRREGFAEYVDMEHLDLVSYEVGRYGRCLEQIEEAKTLARRVYVVSFQDSGLLGVLHREVSFSYACKMLSSVGPSLGHFSGHPTAKEVTGLELKLACETPFLALQAYADLLCLESMSGDVCTHISFGDEAVLSNCILDDLRRSAQRVPLTPYVKRRRTEEAPTAILKASTAVLGDLSSPVCLLLCNEALTPPSL